MSTSITRFSAWADTWLQRKEHWTGSNPSLGCKEPRDWCWTPGFIHLGISLLTCTMGIMVSPYSQGGCENQMRWKFLKCFWELWSPMLRGAWRPMGRERLGKCALSMPDCWRGISKNRGCSFWNKEASKMTWSWFWNFGTSAHVTHLMLCRSRGQNLDTGVDVSGWRNSLTYGGRKKFLLKKVVIWPMAIVCQHFLE